MAAGRALSLWMLALAPCALAGCRFVPQERLAACEAHARSLQEQNRSLVAEVEDSRVHSRNLEDRVRRAEEDVAILEQEYGLERKQLVNYERERDILRRQVRGLGEGGGAVPLGVSARMADLVDRHPMLRLDSRSGIARFVDEINFDTADVHLKPESQQALRRFAEIFQEPEARDLKIMIVGHTDDRAMAKRPAREIYPNNWTLSTSRALAVADYLREHGVPESRMGVTGFAQFQPVVANQNESDRHRNRRVEIYVVSPEMPVVGWVDSTPGLY